jgi:hypothetical protein
MGVIRYRVGVMKFGCIISQAGKLFINGQVSSANAKDLSSTGLWLARVLHGDECVCC